MVFPPKTNYAAGDILTAAQMNNVGNALAAYQFTVGKNKIINGDFSVNQRNFSSTTTTGVFGFDRWQLNLSGATATYSSQAFTLGTAPVVGYESKNFARLQVATGNDFCRLSQAIESVRTFAGQTVTLSFWAKGTNPTTAGNVKASLVQNFGTGGSPSSTIIQQQTFILTGSWTRYSLTFNVASISGKTLGSDGNDCLQVWFGQGDSTSIESYTIDIWGVQLEAGSTATPFTTASGTIQGELALCQRYYIRWTKFRGTAAEAASGSFSSQFSFPVSMRTAPTLATDITNANYNAAGGANTWRFIQQGVGYPTKTGTTSVNLSTIQGNSTTTATIWGNGATWSTSFNEIETNDLYVEAAAEL